MKDGAPLTLSGLSIDGPTWSAIVAALPTSDANPSGQHRPYFPGPACFRETKLLDYIDAQHYIFGDNCSFAKSEFRKGSIWNGSIFRGEIDFSRAKMTGHADFSNTDIGGNAKFPGFECSGLMQLVRTNIKGDLDLRSARTGGIWLSYAEVAKKTTAEAARFDVGEGDSDNASPQLARMDGCKFKQGCNFSHVFFPFETTFGGYADMPPAEIDGTFTIRGSTLGSAAFGGRHLFRDLRFRKADLSNLKIYGSVSFSRSIFESRATFSDWEVCSSDLKDDILSSQNEKQRDDNQHLFSDYQLEITGATFEHGLQIINVSVDGSVSLEFTDESSAVDIDNLTATQSISIHSTNFSTYLPLSLMSDGEVMFDRCQFMRGGIVQCVAKELRIVSCDARQPLTFLTPLQSQVKGFTPLTSLAYSNVENIILLDIDITKGFFSGVANLDKLRLEGSSRKFEIPRRGPNRLVIQDEVLVRAKQRRWRRLLVAQPPPEVSGDPSRVAATYRALRKNREDSKDEPGGADFYYGEMEMRRIDSSWASAERYLLTIYWVVSGYGLRALRAVTFMFAAVGGAAFVLQRWGHAALPPETSYFDSVILLVQVAFGLDRPPSSLNAVGSLIMIMARLVIPALLALAILAIRGRVKR